MRIYLDNCALNRPFDDQSHIRIRIETEAKLYLQEKIKKSEIELIWSYILELENDQSPFEEKRLAIEKWEKLSTVNIDETENSIKRADDFILLGIKAKDALHVSSAIEGNADYFITTDDRLLKKLHGRDDIQAVNPVDIVGEIDEHNN
jgi:predicted nucleic acid-binding protein